MAAAAATIIHDDMHPSWHTASSIALPALAGACIALAFVCVSQKQGPPQPASHPASAPPTSSQDKRKALASRIPDFKSTESDLARVEFPQRPLHMVLAFTGSVASVKAPLIVKELLKYANVRVQVISTRASLRFFDPGRLERDNPGVSVWTDESDWTYFSNVGDPILHIELRRWADLVLVAPCSADSLAHFRYGFAASLLQSFMLALNRSRTQVCLYPAMNTQMYYHPSVQDNLDHARSVLGYQVKGPIQKGLACGDDGIGAMLEWSDIVQDVVQQYGLKLKQAEAT